MREVLEELADEAITVDEAEIALAGYLTDDVGRFDVARESRRGVPEGILAEGKTPDEVAQLAEIAVDATGHAIVTRTGPAHRDAINAHLREVAPEATIDTHERAQAVTVHAKGYEEPTLQASVGIVTAGTADAGPAEEAALIAREMGVDVHTIHDVGVANLTRITDRLPELRSLDVLVVAAGREGALPTVVAGLVDAPVIALPIGSGYGFGGDGEAALVGALQSCTILSTVNVDAGFVAGAQAGLIARQIDRARSDGDEEDR